jgi:hypothetical protein
VENWAEVRRLHRVERMPIKTIARVMGISRNTVRAALRSDGPPKYGRGSVVDDVEPRIRELLQAWPTMPATVIAERIGWGHSIRVLSERALSSGRSTCHRTRPIAPLIWPGRSRSATSGSRRSRCRWGSGRPAARRRHVSMTCGIDWAEAHHDVAVLDDSGTVLERRRIDTGVPGFGQLMAMFAEHAEDPTEVPVAIETDKNLIVVALQAAGLTVYPINPRTVARYRERHGQSGKKSHPGDAFVLADILRHDRHQHRPLPAISEQGRAIKALARQHQEAIWALHQTIGRLRSVLLEFYPQALQAFPNFKHKAALTILAAARPPSSARS